MNRAGRAEIVMARASTNRWLHYCATFVAFSTFLLLIAGALVTSNDAGLSVPDWPTSFGSFRITPPTGWVGGVKFEHGHRLIAGTVALLTFGLALALWRWEERRWVRRLGALAVVAVIAQAVLGGITVLFYLPVDVSVAHASLAQLFFCITVSLALFTRPEWRWDAPKMDDPSTPSLRQLATWTTVLIFVQLMLGAAFRHHGFGIVPHVVVAALVTGGVIWLLVRVLRDFRGVKALERSTIFLTGLLLAQVFLGIASYVVLVAHRGDGQPLPPVVDLTTTHVVVGALVLAASLVVTYRAYQFTSPLRGGVAVPANTSFPQGRESTDSTAERAAI
jgi:heme a synthase